MLVVGVCCSVCVLFDACRLWAIVHCALFMVFWCRLMVGSLCFLCLVLFGVCSLLLFVDWRSLCLVVFAFMFVFWFFWFVVC